MIAHLYFDGSYRHDEKSPIMTGGWIVMLETKPVIIASGEAQKSRSSTGDSTVSEWRALLAGIQYVKNLRNITKLLIKGDNLSVITAIQKSKTKKTNVSCNYASETISWIRKIECEIYAQHIPRLRNSLADSIARYGNKIEFTKEEKLKNLNQQRITSIIAYHLWQQANYPHGKDLEFWLEAENLIFLSSI